MARKAEYTGGPWSIGGVRSNRPKVSPAVRQQQLLRYCEHAQRRISEGYDIYRGILEQYHLELAALSAQTAGKAA